MLEDIKKEQCPLSLLLLSVNECVSTRESKGVWKVKLSCIKHFEMEFKRYLHWVSDARTLNLGQEHMV